MQGRLSNGHYSSIRLCRDLGSNSVMGFVGANAFLSGMGMRNFLLVAYYTVDVAPLDPPPHLPSLRPTATDLSWPSVDLWVSIYQSRECYIHRAGHSRQTFVTLATKERAKGK